MGRGAPELIAMCRRIHTRACDLVHDHPYDANALTGAIIVPLDHSSL